VPRGEPATRRLAVDSDVDRLADVRAFVRDAVTGLGGSPRAADDLVQAVDEAACNVMLHGYGGTPGTIEIEASRRGDAIQIQLLDRAAAFDPTGVERTDPTAFPTPKRPGGMGAGIELIRTMTDEVRHHVRPDGGNELTLVRSIDGPAEEG